MNCDLLVNRIPAGDEEKQNLFRVSVVVHMESGVIVFFFKTSKQQLCLYFLLSLLPPKTFTFVLLILHVSFFFLFLPTHCHLTCRIFPLALWSHHFFPFPFFFFFEPKTLFLEKCPNKCLYINTMREHLRISSVWCLRRNKGKDSSQSLCSTSHTS